MAWRRGGKGERKGRGHLWLEEKGRGRVTDAKSPRPCSDAAFVFHSQALHAHNSENYQMCIYQRPQRFTAGRFLAADSTVQGTEEQADSDYSYKMMVSVSFLLLLYYEGVLRPIVYHFFLPSKLLE